MLHSFPWLYCMLLGLALLLLASHEPLVCDQARAGFWVAGAGGAFLALGLLLFVATLVP